MANLHVMTTSNSKRDYPFSWTLENFHLTSSKVYGPPFSAIPGFPESFRLQCENEIKCLSGYDCYYFYVRLVNMSAKENQMYVSADITVSNRQTILFKKSCGIKRIEPTTTLICYRPDRSSEGLFKEALWDSTLKLEGTLTFSGYELSTSVSVDPLAIQNPLGNYSCRELVKDFKAMYESGHCSDVTFTIGDDKLHAHKAILTARSPVFAKMFEHRMQENITNNVTIEDIDTGTFKDFLLFLYTGAVGDLTCESVVNLYPVSKKYQVDCLQKVCVSLLSSVLSVDYACDVLLLADLYEDKELMEIVKIFVQKNFLDIAVTTKWAELVTNQPELVKKAKEFIKPVSTN